MFDDFDLEVGCEEFYDEDEWASEDEWDYNEDEGFDPYAGCYTWDC